MLTVRVRFDSVANEGASLARWTGLLAMCVLLSVLALGVRGAGADAPYDAEELRFLRLLNEYRQSNGAKPLILSDTLTAAAERHSQDMARYDFFSHGTVRSSYYPAGSRPWDRMAAEGYAYDTYRGENLAVGYETAEQAFRAWQNSPGHNRVMLDGRYRVIGIARVHAPGSRYRWYWTTDFGAVEDPSSHAPGDPARADGRPSAPPDASEVEWQGVDAGGVENGTMESSEVWDQRSRDGAALILRYGYARLGGYDDGEDELRQRVRVKKGSTLVYRLRVATVGRRGNGDRLEVRVTDLKGEALAVLRSYSSKNAGDWRRERVNLSRFAGKTVYLSFHARTDAERISTFYVDDVALRARF